MSISPETIAKINAEVNYDLIKKNSYDKFGNGEYISVETVTDILNETFNYQWSWEIIEFFDKGEFVVCHGRLTVPGLGTRDGIGQAKADKKDNSTMYSAASSFAFKSAAKRIGIAPNIFNQDRLDYPVFEPGTVKVPTQVKNEEKVTNNPVPAEKEIAGAVEKPQVQSQKQVPVTAKEKGAELKEAYNIQSMSQFVAFAQIWNPEIKQFSDLSEDMFHDLHAYVENNPEEFEDFEASDY